MTNLLDDYLQPSVIEWLAVGAFGARGRYLLAIDIRCSSWHSPCGNPREFQHPRRSLRGFGTPAVLAILEAVGGSAGSGGRPLGFVSWRF
jgi:hypothetical protein